MFLQSDLLRVVWATYDASGEPYLQAVHGTAFLVGKDGIFLTAQHVLRAASRPNADGMRPMTFAVLPENMKVASEVIESEDAPTGQDISIGRTNFMIDSVYRLNRQQHTVWTSVISAGYPADAFVNNESGLKTPLRAFRGIIQRLINPNDLHLAPKTQGFELSFSPSPGMSGAPLCVNAVSEHGHLEVVGVCVGAFRSEQVEDEYTEVNKDGSRYTEKRVRITQFGLAEAIYPLLDWKPKILGGQTLGEALCQSITRK